MLFAKIRHHQIFYDVVIDGDRVYPILGSFYGEWKKTGESFDKNEVFFVQPCVPSKVVAVGLNYKKHAKELGFEIPKEPIIFLKPPTTIIGHLDKIIYPVGVERLDYEAELGIVIKKIAKNVSKDDAKNYILGYTTCNDVTARCLQNKDGQWTRAKSFDTFCPIGPIVATDVNPNDLGIELRLNGELKQSSNTSDMIFGCFEIVEFVSKIMTLLPGDVILTGTPEGVGPMQKGDSVEVRIDKIGKLENFVR